MTNDIVVNVGVCVSCIRRIVLTKNAFLRKGCILHTCNKLSEKLLECNHSANRRGYATGATQRLGTEQLSVSSTAIKLQCHFHWP